MVQTLTTSTLYYYEVIASSYFNKLTVVIYSHTIWRDIKEFQRVVVMDVHKCFTWMSSRLKCACVLCQDKTERQPTANNMHQVYIKTVKKVVKAHTLRSRGNQCPLISVVVCAIKCYTTR
jgi:chorismate mutase